jgi:tetratricopeptide (TPR) repeat protein
VLATTDLAPPGGVPLFNALEVENVKAMTREARVLLGVLLVGGIGAIPASLRAQQQEIPRLLVTTFRSGDKGVGADAAEQIRKKVKDEVDDKKLLVIPKDVIAANLKASGFNPDSAPDPITSRLLAQQLRADQYLDGTAAKTPKGYRIDARVVLTSNINMVQPLPPAEAEDLDDAAKVVAQSFVAERKQLEHVLACEHALQAGQFAQAATHGRAAVAAYPPSTNGRVCLAQAYAGLKAPPDSIIAATAKVVQTDPTNKPALGLLAQAYMDAGQAPKAVETWSKLIKLDPKNVALQRRVVADLARTGHADLAKPMINQAVAANPGDASLLRLQWLVLFTSKDWKGAITAGEALAKADTSAADTTFFTRLASAYAADSQPQKAAETTSRGVAKFPNNAALWALNAQTLHLAGQTQQSMDAAKRAIAIDPKVDRVWLTLAQGQMELGRTDSAMTSLKNARSNGADTATINTFALVLGNKAYQHADTTKAVEDYQHAIHVLSVADSVAPSVQIKYLLGVSGYFLGEKLARQNQKEKSCELVQQTEDAFAIAQINIPQAGQVAPQAAQQILGQLQQYDPYVKSQKKAYCKK